jgi:xanthine dehydrogenase accessory factor
VRELLAELERARTRGERVAIATVVATRRSAPRPVGSKLLVTHGGELHGSVSGGCVESDVYESCQAVLGGAPPELLSYGISDDQAFEVGLPCGGEIDVFVEEPDPALLAQVEEIIRDERRAVVFTNLDDGVQRLAREGEDPDADALIRGGRSKLIEVDERTVFADVLGPPPRVFVYGAVDTAEALCRAAKTLGWHTIVADARGKFATRERLPSADEIVVAWPEEAFAQVAPDHATAVVVLTHDDKFDIPALRDALRTDAFYVGALGSRRNQERRRERLLEAGVPEEALERIHGPAGLDLGAATPGETALSILAEIVASRFGRSGGPLRESAQRIHAEI